MNNWLDSHCHLNDEAFDEDLNDTLKRMIDNDVKRCMLVSCTPFDYERGLKINHPEIEIKRAIGIFPEYTDLSDEEYKAYEKYFDEADAIGEIGLDYHWYPETKEKQKALFIKQIELANKLNKPIIVHARDASQDAFDILKAHPCRGLLHCYSGSAEMAKELVKLGYYISIAGPITWKNAKAPLEVIKAIPVDRLLIETDSPYLTPAPNRGKRNEPSNVVYVGRVIAKELGIAEEEFKAIINKNYDALFGKTEML